MESVAERSAPVSLRTNNEWFLLCLVQRTKVTSSDLLTASSRRALFDSLIREAHVMTLLRRGKVIPCIPVTPCRKHIMDLLPLPVCASLETELVECIGCEVLGLCVVIAAHVKR